MDTAYDILNSLMESGLSLNDVAQITGVGKSTLYAIRDGTRSGQTSLPQLRQLVQARVTTAPATVMPSPTSPIIVDSTPPTPSTPSHLPVPTFPPLPPQKHTSGLSPEKLFAEIQAVRAENREIKTLLLQQNKPAYVPKQRTSAPYDSGYDSGAAFANNIVALIESVGQAIDNRRDRKQHEAHTQQIAAPRYAGQTPATPERERQLSQLERIKQSMAK